MGNGSSAGYDDKTNLNRGLAACIRDVMRPTEMQISEAWEQHDEAGRGLLSQEEVLSVLQLLIDLQIKAAQEASSKRKMEMARQQAQMERESRKRRSDVLSKMPGETSRQDLDSAVVLAMATKTAPVMAGMMAGYMDIPVTCLTALREDRDLLEARVTLLFSPSAGPIEQDGRKLVTRQQFVVNYTALFEHAPQALNDTVVAETSSSECALQ
mmetsp:Transcript_16508/g.45763  ORF Transcript_16508/g.45763 Transcript_16508/m.45763 type:complete len:212 (-) Transcript_16508:109-744(-)|eukprot:CAMPEP_0177223404 /NCGR_PEP_ID=MMETSP0367-20130122/38459_1 /TAXON_ID=447022 ORGANISM="Scrippsiella hangoei-like, Strain SHHI-4" /NCGR_SAMPLE_ID=MMETSP0367 /ASSEMBLY_ACC=CAM_ASM_000362 /LENGTH=211 /DNA_ID=CAMNT_0018673357 /DNA_START=62 /DNA_END=697 /DNA_ORIENTATION=-